jgi:hypothetical protein
MDDEAELPRNTPGEPPWFGIPPDDGERVVTPDCGGTSGDITIVSPGAGLPHVVYEMKTAA